MRIAYVAPYQGPTLLQRRPIIRNRTMAGARKMELIAEMLRHKSHDVEVISQGEVIESGCRFYPSFSEPERFHPDIPVYYASSLPVRRLNGAWSNRRTLDLFKQRHRVSPYDVVLIYNLQGPQLTCAIHAVRRLRLPVILEYEDDRFVDVQGEAVKGLSLRLEARASMRLFPSLAGCVAVSPYLRSQLPAQIPGVLVRGVVGHDLIKATRDSHVEKSNIVLFSGTHIASNGIAQLIEAWKRVGLPEWELHITGHGGLTDSLRQMAAGVPGIVFRGMVNRDELIRLMCSAKICMNPHQLSQTPGNVFAFKIVEYLAAGGHVITTPMGVLEHELEAGITYMPDNAPETIAATIRRVVENREYTRTAMEAAQRTYGPTAVSTALDRLLEQVRAAK